MQSDRAESGPPGVENRRAAGQRKAYDLTLGAADYPEWQGPPRRTLLVCTQQRSGSTLLGEAIYFAGALGCPLEYFHEGFRPSFQTRWATSDLPAYAAALHRFRTDPSGVFSVKLFWSDVVALVQELMPGEFDTLPLASASRTDDRTYRRVVDVIAPYFPSPTFILLTRQDEIGQAVSTAVASRTGAWRQLTDRKASSSVPNMSDSFHHIVHVLADIQNDNAHWINFCRVIAQPYHRLGYEDLASDYRGTLAALFAALGRPDAQVAVPRLRKQADERSEELRRQFLAEFQQRARG